MLANDAAAPLAGYASVALGSDFARPFFDVLSGKLANLAWSSPADAADTGAAEA